MTHRTPVLVPLLATATALVFFAANSVLCRLALGNRATDALSFTALRLGSGAIALLLVTLVARSPDRSVGGSWLGAFWLVLYALPFSLAYRRLDTGTGALLLFGTVQATMIGAGLRSGERPGRLEWLGLLAAAGGVAYLVFPGLSAPDPVGAAEMIAAGVGWGAYSIAGRGARDPVSVTAGNFQRAAIVVVPAAALAWSRLSLSTEGALLAVCSGAITSGLGYTLWYAALRHISVTRAALVQLAVPVLAAGGGVLFVGERATLRLVLAGGVVLGSIALGILGRTLEPRR